jgi:hypothetical protein
MKRTTLSIALEHAEDRRALAQQQPHGNRALDQRQKRLERLGSAPPDNPENAAEATEQRRKRAAASKTAGGKP